MHEYIRVEETVVKKIKSIFRRIDKKKINKLIHRYRGE